jgi:hypothetical protein
VSPEYNPLVQEENRAVRAPALILGGVTFALIAGGALLFLTAPSSKPPPAPAAARIRFVPLLGPTTGAMLSGTF